jgi:uncharacterized protein (TIGR02246 family)
MPKYRTALVRITICLLAGVAAISFAGISRAQASDHVSSQASDEQAVWNLEHEYWRDVQDNNLTAYLALWHKNFLGWPRFNDTPVGKDHITDWITSQTAKGLTFTSTEIKPAKIQVTGDIAVACYWVTHEWMDKNGKGTAQTSRIIHTWVRGGKDKDWQIIGGMSMPGVVPSQN